MYVLLLNSHNHPANEVLLFLFKLGKLRLGDVPLFGSKWRGRDLDLELTVFFLYCSAFITEDKLSKKTKIGHMSPEKQLKF